MKDLKAPGEFVGLEVLERAYLARLSGVPVRHVMREGVSGEV